MAEYQTQQESRLRSDLKKIAEQEAALVFAHFDAATAWRLGEALRAAALALGAAVTIDIRRGEDILFFHAMDGTTPANADWARRKRNTVEMFRRSSYAVGLEGQLNCRPILELMGLPARDYTLDGGCFPLLVRGAGQIGTATVSGLPQREDHGLLAATLARLLDLDPGPLMLA